MTVSPISLKRGEAKGKTQTRHYPMNIVELTSEKRLRKSNG